MELQEVRHALDKMGVPWDDPIRSEAIEFAARDMDEKLLWLFIEGRRQKQVKPWREKLYDYGAIGAWVAYVLFDNRDQIPHPGR